MTTFAFELGGGDPSMSTSSSLRGRGERDLPRTDMMEEKSTRNSSEAERCERSEQLRMRPRVQLKSEGNFEATEPALLTAVTLAICHEYVTH